MSTRVTSLLLDLYVVTTCQDDHFYSYVLQQTATDNDDDDNHTTSILKKTTIMPLAGKNQYPTNILLFLKKVETSHSALHVIWQPF